MKITKTKDKITFEFEAERPRYNPYMSDEEQALLGTYPIFTGLIWRGKSGNDKIGFAYTIDMDYKGKPDQISDFAVMWDGSEESFIQKCKELKIDVQIMKL